MKGFCRGARVATTRNAARDSATKPGRDRVWAWAVTVALTALVGVAGRAPTAWAEEELFVTDRANNSVTVYTRTASGNIVPLRTLSGGATGLSGPFDLAVDAVNNELVVTNYNNNSVTVYPRTASENTAPLRTLSGGATGLSGPSDVVVDSLNNELLVSNNLGNSVTVYPRTATGNTAPLRILSGPATLLHAPFGLAVDVVNNELMVTNFFGNSVTVYPRTATGSTAPVRILTGTATGLDFPVGVAVDAVNNELMVTNVGNNSVTVYPRTATENTAPIRTLQGTNTGLVNPGFAAITTTGSPVASVALNNVAVGTGQTITYQATLTPGVTPTQVDIYLGCLLPDGVTFLSLIQTGPGTTSISLGPSPIPFQSNVPLVPTIVQFSYQFEGSEPRGTYFTYARLTVAGSNPFLPANQISLTIEPDPSLPANQISLTIQPFTF